MALHTLLANADGREAANGPHPIPGGCLRRRGGPTHLRSPMWFTSAPANWTLRRAAYTPRDTRRPRRHGQRSKGGWRCNAPHDIEAAEILRGIYR